MTMVGYARVSTKSQDLAIQQEALRAAGCEKLFYEKMSGARSDRAQLAKMLKGLELGDIVIVTRLDRLARSSRDLLNVIHQINEAGATFKSLADAWCDTTTPHGKLILTVLAGLAEFERTLIIARVGEGIARARANGVTFGRTVKLNPKQRRIIADRYSKGKTIRDLAAEFEVGVATIHRALKAAA